jgi:tetratricopeptide (TPR) repeat protein
MAQGGQAAAKKKEDGGGAGVKKSEEDAAAAAAAKKAEEKKRAEALAKKKADEGAALLSKKAAEKIKVAKGAKNSWKERVRAWWQKGMAKRYLGGAVAVGVLAALYSYYMALPPDMSDAQAKMAEENYLIGNTYFEQGDISKAILHYRTAVMTNPKHADCWTNLGNALSSAMHYHPDHRETLYTEGIKAYTAALEANPKHIEANFNMGVLHHTLDDIPKAILAYERAIELDPKHYDALSNLGSARHKQQNLDGAIEAYQQAIELVTAMSPVQVEQTQISMLYYLLGAALSALPSRRCKGASCAEYAAQKLRVALRYNPKNEEAKHALSALVADPAITTASSAYIKSLFDEYAAVLSFTCFTCKNVQILTQLPNTDL